MGHRPIPGLHRQAQWHRQRSEPRGRGNLYPAPNRQGHHREPGDHEDRKVAAGMGGHHVRGISWCGDVTTGTPAYFGEPVYDVDRLNAIFQAELSAYLQNLNEYNLTSDSERNGDFVSWL